MSTRAASQYPRFRVHQWIRTDIVGKGADPLRFGIDVKASKDAPWAHGSVGTKLVVYMTRAEALKAIRELKAKHCVVRRGALRAAAAIGRAS